MRRPTRTSTDYADDTDGSGRTERLSTDFTDDTGGSGRTEGLSTDFTDYIARPRRPQPNLMEPPMNTDEHRLSPDSNPSLASPGVALDDGLQDPDGLRTEAAERNIIAKTMMLRPCSTDCPERTRN